MNRPLKWVMRGYLVGAAAMAIDLFWSAIEGGALERQHGARDWLIIALGYATYMALWPIAVIIILLMYFGIIHGQMGS
jgi:hypothetical protein